MKFANLLLLFEVWLEQEDFLIAINVYLLQSFYYSKKAYNVVKVPWVLEIILILVYLIVGLDRVEKIKDKNCCCKVIKKYL